MFVPLGNKLRCALEGRQVILIKTAARSDGERRKQVAEHNAMFLSRGSSMVGEMARVLTMN